MTEQERPRTEEAWKDEAWAAWLRAEHPGAATFIEAEGRQQAVRDLKAVRPEWLPCTCIDAYKDRGLEAPDCLAHDIDRWFDAALRLNASESPPLDPISGLPEHIMGALASEIRGDASESPPTEPHRDYAGRTCTTGLMHSHGDASESPRRFAALMETDDLARDRFGDASESGQPPATRDASRARDVT